MTLTNLLNEVFATLFAENQAFISAVTPGNYEAPLTYSLELPEEIENAEKCIFIIEDSQLDIGLLVAVERNVNRILQIVADYLIWNDEQIEESIRQQNAPAPEKISDSFSLYSDTPVNSDNEPEDSDSEPENSADESEISETIPEESVAEESDETPSETDSESEAEVSEDE
jgi:hypothetical protein